MMLTRFALLAVVVAALACLSEARAASGGNDTSLDYQNVCGNVLKPDDAKLQEYLAACKPHFNAEDLQAYNKCMMKQLGWVTAAGVFDEAAFRAFVAGKLANITTLVQTLVNAKLHPEFVTAITAVQTHISSRLDGCLTAEDMAAKNVMKIGKCIIKDCPTATAG